MQDFLYSLARPFKSVEGNQSMYDPQKIEDAVLALLGAFEFDNGRAWKRIDFSVMEALAEKGYISNPHGRSESIHLTKDGLTRAKELAERMFSE